MLSHRAEHDAFAEGYEIADADVYRQSAAVNADEKKRKQLEMSRSGSVGGTGPSCRRLRIEPNRARKAVIAERDQERVEEDLENAAFV